MPEIIHSPKKLRLLLGLQQPCLAQPGQVRREIFQPVRLAERASTVPPRQQSFPQDPQLGVWVVEEVVSNPIDRLTTQPSPLFTEPKVPLSIQEKLAKLSQFFVQLYAAKHLGRSSHRFRRAGSNAYQTLRPGFAAVPSPFEGEAGLLTLSDD
jgi:hypothetical protein